MSSLSKLALPTRTFGKTEVQVPLFGLGTGEGGMGLDDEAAIHLYRKAIESGVFYIDTSPGYGNAHAQLARALEGVRQDVFLATKVLASNGPAFKERLEKNLLELKTDYVDVLYIHSVGQLDIEELLSPSGSLWELIRAKERGLARFIGITAHNRPGHAERILHTYADLDVGMFAMNFIEDHIYGFKHRVLPLARQRNMGIAAMKVYGGAPEAKYDRPVPSALQAKGDFDHHLAFRYALSLPGVSTNVIGVYTEAELMQNIQWVQTFAPLSDSEQEELKSIGKTASLEWGPRHGPVE